MLRFVSGLCLFCSAAVAEPFAPLLDAFSSNSRTIDATALVLCTEFDDVDIEYFDIFLHSVFPDRKHPDVYINTANFRKRMPQKDDEQIAFVYFGTKRFDKKLADCVAQFPSLEISFEEKVNQTGMHIGTLPDFLAKQPLGHLMAPVVTTSSMVPIQKSSVIIYLTRRMDKYRNSEFVKSLFGLNRNCCETTRDGYVEPREWPLR